jgi:hypothetical protein
MNRPLLYSLAVTPLVVAFAACGDPNRASVATEPTSPVTVVASTIPEGIVHPTGADDLVLKISYEGGLVPLEYHLVDVPELVVSGDGRIFTPAPASTQAPGPLMENILVRQISEDGVQALLRVVDSAGLLAPPPEYPDRHNVADAPDTVLTLVAAGGTFVHSAYGLGIGDPETGVRKTLFDAVNTLIYLEPIPTSNIDQGTSFIPVTYRLRASAVDLASLPQPDPGQSVVDWPADAGVSLADASECARVGATAVGSLFIEAMQNTYFKDGDIVYRVVARGVLPGDPAC